MNKSELVEALAARNGLSYKKSEEFVNIIFDSLADTLTAGGRIGDPGQAKETAFLQSR
ncbi:MAG: HU family DNA-binding protein [Desulfuromonadales bacterium]